MSIFGKLIPGWVPLVVIAALCMALAGQQMRVSLAHAALAKEQKARSDDRADHERTAREETDKAREREQKLQTDANTLERQKDESILNLDVRLRDALGRLSDRPDRPASVGAVPSNPSPAQACTGAGLHRQDAEFLVRESASAARILAERDYCHERYDALLHPAGR